MELQLSTALRDVQELEVAHELEAAGDDDYESCDEVDAETLRSAVSHASVHSRQTLPGSNAAETSEIPREGWAADLQAHVSSVSSIQIDHSELLTYGPCAPLPYLLRAESIPSMRHLTLSGKRWSKLKSACGIGHCQDYALASEACMGDSPFETKVIVPTSSERARSVCGLPVLRPNNQYVRAWMVFNTCVDVIYTAFIAPLSACFSTNLAKGGFAVVDFLAGLVFLFSLLLGFHIGFIAQHKQHRMLVMEGKDVASYYIKHNNFLMDFAASVSFAFQIALIIVINVIDSQVSTALLRYIVNSIQLLRLCRLFAFSALFQELLMKALTSKSQFSKWLSSSWIYMLLVAYMVLWVINLVGCVWFFMGSWHAFEGLDNWIASYIGSPALEDGCGAIMFTWQPEMVTGKRNPCPWVDKADIPRVSLGTAYVYSCYWALTTLSTVGYGDILPKSSGEYWFAVFVMVIGVAGFAMLIGTIQELFQKLSSASKLSAQLYERLRTVSKWMKKLRLPHSIQQQIRRFYFEVWAGAGGECMEGQVFQDVPHQLRSILARHMTNNLLAEARVFKDLSEADRASLAPLLMPVAVGPGIDICLEGEEADCAWILQEGIMLSLYADQATEVEEAPTIIAESAIISNLDKQFARRPCGYRSSTHCFLWQLEMSDLRKLMKRRPEAANILYCGVAEHMLKRASATAALRKLLCIPSLNTVASEQRDSRRSSMSSMSQECASETVPKSQRADSGPLPDAITTPAGGPLPAIDEAAVVVDSAAPAVNDSEAPSDGEMAQGVKVSGVGQMSLHSIVRLTQVLSHMKREQARVGLDEAEGVQSNGDGSSSSALAPRLPLADGMGEEFGSRSDDFEVSESSGRGRKAESPTGIRRFSLRNTALKAMGQRASSQRSGAEEGESDGEGTPTSVGDMGVNDLVATVLGEIRQLEDRMTRLAQTTPGGQSADSPNLPAESVGGDSDS